LKSRTASRNLLSASHRLICRKPFARSFWMAGLGESMSLFGWASRSAAIWRIIFILAALLSLTWYVSDVGPAAFVQQLLNGLQRGSIYALIALGFTMVYGIVKLINFAHGDIFMFGAYVACFAGATLLGSGHWVAFVGALVIAMTLTALL